MVDKENAIRMFCTSLNSLGPTVVLDLLVRASATDPMAHELLCIFPSVVSIGDFLGGLPTLRIKKSRRVKRGVIRKKPFKNAA